MVHTPSPGHVDANGKASPCELRRAIERVMGEQLCPIGVGIAGVYAVSVTLQATGGGWAARGSQIVAAAAVALFAATIALATYKQWLPSRWSHQAMFALGLASLGEATWCIIVSPKPSESLYIALVILGCGMLLLAPLSWATLVSAATAVWICVSVVLTPELDWQAYQFVIIGTIMLSGVSMAMRLKVIERLEAERLSRTHHARQLQVSEQRQSIILDMLPMAMYTVKLIDGKMRTTWVSDKISRLTGYEPQQFIDDRQLWNRNIHPDERPLMLRQARAIDAEGQAAEEFRWQCADGEYRWFLDHAVATYDKHGHKDGLIGVWLDIDERKRVTWEKSRLELELRQAQKLEAVGTLASGIAHDFNNLLAAINGFASAARESLDQTHPTQEYLARIEEAAESARHVTRSLLTFAHHAPSQKRPVRLAQLIEETTPLLRRLLARNVRIDTADTDQTLWIHADPMQVQRVLVNLAINAGDAMAECGGTMRFALQREANDAILIVEDDGPGMSEQVRERIFEPFFTTHPRGEGTGLGLPVVHGILTDHHATISVDSTPGRGTRFVIRIPTCRPPTKPSVESGAPRRSGAACNQTLLLAEPDAYIRQIMAETLESHGYAVHGVDDGVQAAQWLATHDEPIALLIADSGVETSWVADARIGHPELKVILISESPHDLPGDEPVLTKPFQMSKLVEWVERSLAGEPLTELQFERSD